MLTNYSFYLGGTKEVSFFWVVDWMIGCLPIIFKFVILPFVTLPLLPYTCNMKCLIFEWMKGLSEVLLLLWHPLPYQTQPYLALFKIGSVYFFQWISGYIDAWLPMHMILVGPMKCLIFELMNGWLDVLLLPRHPLPYQT